LGASSGRRFVTAKCSMSEPEAIAEARRWLRFAAEDLRAAESMLANQEMIPRHACWLAQQAAEKALKAGLVLEQIPFPFRHDLDALRNLLPDRWATRQLHPDLAELTEWAVEARYPGDWTEATQEDARTAVQQAQAVYESVSVDAGRLGLAVDSQRES
jgi:HEPN domain-containing protein